MQSFIRICQTHIRVAQSYPGFIVFNESPVGHKRREAKQKFETSVPPAKNELKAGIVRLMNSTDYLISNDGMGMRQEDEDSPNAGQRS